MKLLGPIAVLVLMSVIMLLAASEAARFARQERTGRSAQRPEPPAIYFPQQSASLPPSIVVRAYVAEQGQVCAELADGYVACRSVRDFRLWVRQRETRKE